MSEYRIISREQWEADYRNQPELEGSMEEYANSLPPLPLDDIRECLVALKKKTQMICNHCGGSGNVVDYFNGEPMKYADKKECPICSGKKVIVTELALNAKAKSALKALEGLK